MRGSRIASIIDSEYRREQFYKNKVARNKCLIDNLKKCDECKYKEICEDREVKDECKSKH